jgi:hypothetical protein
MKKINKEIIIAKIYPKNQSIGFLGILTLIFVLAKIFNKIDWSWWWVFSPIWLPAVITIVIVGIILLVVAFMSW